MVASIIEQFGGEGFVDMTDLITKTTFNRTGTLSLDALSVFGVTNEKWIRADTGEFLYRPLYPTTQPTTRKHAELSFAIYFSADPNFAYNLAAIDSHDSSSGGTLQMGVGLSLVGNVGSGLINEFQIRFLNLSGATPANINTGILAEAGKVFYVTIRSSSESSSPANDAAVEVYINGVSVAQETGINWGDSSFTEDSRWDGTANAEAYVGGGGTSLVYYRNITLWDGWSTADGVAPPLKHINDLVPTGVTAAGYTNEGGAGSQTIALSDDVDTTYLATSSASEEMLITYTPETLLATSSIADVYTRLKGARGGISLNTIDVELTDLTGTTSLDSKTNNMSAVAPIRENINTGLIPNVATNANAFALKITNGS